MIHYIFYVLLLINYLSFADKFLKEECFEKIYKFVNSLDWRKGIKVWQAVFGQGSEDPFQGERELEGKYCPPKPEVDLKQIKNECLISANLPQELLSSILASKENNSGNIGKLKEKFSR